MICILDRQHYGKPGRDDRGAGFDIDDDGAVERHEQEVYFTGLYISAARALLEEAGVRVVVIDSGHYGERHERANVLARRHPGPAVYVACHMNAYGVSVAPGRDYSLVCYDHRSRLGAELGDDIRAALARRLPSIPRHLALAAHPDEWTANAFHTIDGIYSGPRNVAGVCFEPLAVDHHAHLLTPGKVDGTCKAIAVALVDGVEANLRRRVVALAA